MSNVALWSAADSRGVRVRVKGEGREKVRVSARSGEPIKAGGKAQKAARPAKPKGGKPEGD